MDSSVRIAWTSDRQNLNLAEQTHPGDAGILVGLHLEMKPVLLRRLTESHVG